LAPSRNLIDTPSVTYDLFVLPVDRALTFAEASAEIERLQRSLGFRRGHDARLDPFLALLGRRYWQVRARTPIPPPFELDVARSYAFVGIPWDRVDEVLGAVAEAAHATGMAVWDPQRRMVGLPDPFAPEPMTTEGTDVHVARAMRVLDAIGRRAMATPLNDVDLAGPIPDAFISAAFGRPNPLGIEATPELARALEEDPTRVPAALQTVERRDALVHDLAGGHPAERHLAVAQLAGWAVDPVVAAALRRVVASEDVYEATTAATGLARQGDITDLPSLLDAVFRLSPADGASATTMVGPLRAALELAALAGPAAVEGVRARARGWRAEAPRRARDRETDAELDALLGA
jgi:hypothetical protein